jgi:hypothetical protein
LITDRYFFRVINVYEYIPVRIVEAESAWKPHGIRLVLSRKAILRAEFSCNNQIIQFSLYFPGVGFILHPENEQDFFLYQPEILDSRNL